MIIPWQELEDETLNNIIEKALAEKVADIKTQLQQGLVVIVWSEIHETINLKYVADLK